MPTIRIALVLVSLSAAPAHSLTKIFVHETATGGGGNQACAFVTTQTNPGHGNTPTNPLKLENGVSGLRQAIDCANRTSGATSSVYNDDVEIVVMCTSPLTSGSDAGFCVHSYTLAQFNTNYPDTSGLTRMRLVRSEPAWANKIKPSTSSSLKILGERWTFDGFYFDGNGQHSRGSFLLVGGKNNTLRNGFVGNTKGTCINVRPDVADPLTDSSPRPENITIENNVIKGCYEPAFFNYHDLLPGTTTCTSDANCASGFACRGPSAGPKYCYRTCTSNSNCTGSNEKCVADPVGGSLCQVKRKEPHCIHTSNGKNVTIARNDLSDCSSDGLQVEAYLSTSSSEPKLTTGAAQNITIEANRLWAQSYTSSDAPVPQAVNRTIGENGLDIKKMHSGLRIRENLLWGYRASKAKCAVQGINCASTEHRELGLIPFAGTGDDDRGVAVLLHGAFELPPSCTDTEGSQCAIIERNEVFDSQGGMSVGSSPENGNPTGVDVRGNFIHDLRGIGLRYTPSGTAVHDLEPRMRGQGFHLNSGLSLRKVRVYRNTLANVPADTIRFDSAASNTYVVNNLIAATTGPTPSGSNSCSLSSNGGLPTLHHNLFSWTRDTAGTNNPTPFVPPFKKPFHPRLRNEDIPGGSICYLDSQCASGNCSRGFCTGVTMRRCGATEPREQENPVGYFSDLDVWEVDRTTVHNARDRFDYRLSTAFEGTSAPEDHAGSDTTTEFTRTSAIDGATCGLGPEFGAHEICATRRILIRESSATDGSERPEVFTGAAWWNSPEVGFVPSGFFIPPLGRMLPNWTKPVDWRQGSRFGSVIVRLTTEGSLATDAAVPVRVWGAPSGTDPRFSRAWKLLVTGQVNWCSGSSCRDSTYGLWAWHAGTGNTRQFIFNLVDDRVMADLGSLRAEVGTAEDPRPSPFLHVANSNNLAQANRVVPGFPVRRPAFTISLERDYPGSPVATTELKVHRVMSTSRPAWVYFPDGPLDMSSPSSNAAKAWSDTNSGTFPPYAFGMPAGRLVSIGTSVTTISGVSLPAKGARTIQVLVEADNPTGLDATEYVHLEETGRGGVRTYLTSPGYLRESFEWGWPVGWTRQGNIWNTYDEFDQTCADGSPAGSGDTGRKSLGFTKLDTCNYEFPCGTGGVSDIVSTATVAWGPNSRLTFSQWSQTERYSPAAYDIRRVWLVRSGSQPTMLAQWDSRNPDHGSLGNWVTTSLDLSPYWVSGTTVQIEFEFNTVDCSANNFRGWFIDDVEIDSP